MNSVKLYFVALTVRMTLIHELALSFNLPLTSFFTTNKSVYVFVQANYEKDKQCVYLKIRVRDETKNFVE